MFPSLVMNTYTAASPGLSTLSGGRASKALRRSTAAPEDVPSSRWNETGNGGRFIWGPGVELNERTEGGRSWVPRSQPLDGPKNPPLVGHP